VQLLEPFKGHFQFSDQIVGFPITISVLSRLLDDSNYCRFQLKRPVTQEIKIPLILCLVLFLDSTFILSCPWSLDIVVTIKIAFVMSDQYNFNLAWLQHWHILWDANSGKT
jgi:hypothetical protein